MNQPYRTYPVFLRVEERACVVVGGGPIGAQKCRELLESGGFVTLISPTRCTDFDTLERNHTGRLRWLARPFAEGDLDGAMIVFSATADAAVDARIHREALKTNTLVNIVDVPEKCDFFAGSVVRRGAVTVAIGTGGASPSLAIALRERIEAVLPSTIGPIAEALAAARPALLAAFPVYAERARRMRAWVEAALQHDHIDSNEQIAEWASNAVRCDRPCDANTSCRCVRPVHEATHHVA